ncbi:SCP2 sterol-binding domain-containing protein [Neobacillus thermocopriae]|uniref:SCP2 sterol-binding domain-containing protein n=1 Tax=Neobacillus thermocopriae TaxID=1215031 RepID=A0A6B3TK40_9BACI|nr:SCP2 sterol-binding domain-containing protein [Neobacillus thermocopriae]MED3622472.1 SCP2 sterol-binding domain-containing protein [Neobacillus thermocopriae]MED3714047.1 SCP2 sterol-binding domain-containing protein [Neobacillus thermocopriae]NEX77295.1 SCP2 sterol-binding domain-containing protein [Neobacillus thermocopriae]
MIEAVQVFLQEVKKRNHLFPLIDQVDIRVVLKSEQQTIQFIIKNGEILFLHERNDSQPHCLISGSSDGLAQLLKGQEKLRTLERIGSLTITAPLRTVLLLESIFYLANSRNEKMKKRRETNQNVARLGITQKVI